ncbi:MAG: heme-binding protein [Alphaproteobacteria bacterium]|nr:heme-binding protein [Alphaproteobacteria bacterium]
MTRHFLGTLLALCLGVAFAPGALAQQALTKAQVDRIVSQAAEEARARNVANATIAVVDRVGNVLGVYRLGANSTITISSGRNIPLGNGLDKVPLGTDAPAPLNGIDGAAYAAIAKAVTGAYLSSSGNAFTTRTASQIVQEWFNVGERGQPAGPLYGVQFSSLTCSDLVNKGETVGFGPRRTPLGLSADPGGLPLYFRGVVVGGIGVIADRLYSLDLDIRDYDRSIDELIAIAGQAGFMPSVAIRAHRITVGGPSLRYADVDARYLVTRPARAPALPVGGAYITVPGYIDVADSRAGTAYGAADGSSGYRRAMAGDDGGVGAPFQPLINLGAFILVDNTNTNRFAPIDGFDLAGNVGGAGDGLQAAEVAELLVQAFRVARVSRAQIRKPLSSFVQVTISVVDVRGNILGIVRTPDAPVFGTDVSLQKARSAMLFSRMDAGAIFDASGATAILGLIPVQNGQFYADRMRAFVGGNALANGVAYGARSIGNLHRPFFPDGVDKQKLTGPLSTPYATWSPFNVGLQLDLVFNDIILGLVDPNNASNLDPTTGCANGAYRTDTAGQPNIVADANDNLPLLRNGLQIFAGGVPIYRGNALIGGIGISGDGIDQDDMVAFLGTHNASLFLGGAINNAPKAIRANAINVQGTSLRYVACPFAPIIRSRLQEPCRNK